MDDSNNVDDVRLFTYYLKTKYLPTEKRKLNSKGETQKRYTVRRIGIILFTIITVELVTPDFPS
jgi:hypothetical protein